MKKNILFVCTGNTCRSPMAEAFFNKIIKEEGYDKEYTCSSAGIYAYEGDCASYEAIQVMKNHGLDISRHYSKVLDHKAVREAYIILTMTRDHKRMVLDVYPEAADKIFTLKEFAEYTKDDWDITDPFGLGLGAYEACAEELKTVLYKILDML
jgi:protein-tyrosine phosphatase